MGQKRWSKYVTRHSFALDLEKGVFTWSDPKKIAIFLRKSAENSLRRKAPPFQSAMSMLNFYINRAGKNLKPERRKILEQAKARLATPGVEPQKMAELLLRRASYLMI